MEFCFHPCTVPRECANATLPCGARLDAHKSENRKRNRKGKGKGKGSPSWNFALKVKERGGHYFFSNNKELTLKLLSKIMQPGEVIQLFSGK